MSIDASKFVLCRGCRSCRSRWRRLELTLDTPWYIASVVIDVPWARRRRIEDEIVVLVYLCTKIEMFVSCVCVCSRLSVVFQQYIMHCDWEEEKFALGTTFELLSPCLDADVRVREEREEDDPNGT